MCIDLSARILTQHLSQIHILSNLYVLKLRVALRQSQLNAPAYLEMKPVAMEAPFYTLKSNSNWNNSFDIHGKKIGVGQLLAAGAFALPWMVRKYLFKRMHLNFKLIVWLDPASTTK